MKLTYQHLNATLVLIVLFFFTVDYGLPNWESYIHVKTQSAYTGTIKCSLWLETNGRGKQFTDPSECHVLASGNDLKVFFISSIDRTPGPATSSSITVKSDGSVLMMLGEHTFRFKTDDSNVQMAVDIQRRKLYLKCLKPLFEEGPSGAHLITGSFIDA